MPEYRFYRVDQYGHRFETPEVADYSGDDEAIAHVKQILTGYAGGPESEAR
jgi:hypothetical protein